MKKVLYFFILIIIGSCKYEDKKIIQKPLFTLLPSDTTNITFQNKLSPTNTLNIFNYMYFYNGGGVAAADLNNDTLVDIIFTSNQGKNKLYLNKGNLKFEDVSGIAGFDSNAWSTGVNIIDINQDGLKDVYICQVDNGEQLRGHNLLYVAQNINENGIPIYKELAKEYGLDFSGYSTQSAFLDYDLDGDLDMYLLNHSVHKNGTFGERKYHTGKYHEKSGDRIYRNENGNFLDVTKQTGINSNALGYGLGIKVSDINLDGWPDIYIGNDFHENDYLYINQKDGTFKDEMDEHIMHTSRFTMGVDIADFNNDMFSDIFTLDMLPEDYEILKRSEGEDLYNIYLFKLSQGYNQQYTRNCLQLNRKNGFFSEIGIHSGVHASDWSWSTFFSDLDNDGWKDIFISNGIPRRMNDIDYIDFIVDDVIQTKITEKKFDESDLEMLKKLPEIKIKNKLYLNQKNLKFKDSENGIANDFPTFSNGAIYADLDNDGDLEIVTNNINDEVSFYKNLSVENYNKKGYKIALSGSEKNKEARGAKVLIYAENKTQYIEYFPEKGYLSSINTPINYSTESGNLPDSIKIIWADNTFQTKKDISIKTTIKYQSNSPTFDYLSFKKSNSKDLIEIKNIPVDISHKENNFEEFSREFLMPQMTSTDGPALAYADVNKDGIEDVFLGGARFSKAQLFLGTNNGFKKTKQPSIEMDSMYEDVVSVFYDVNNDGNIDLIVGSGGNEFYNKSENNLPRIYINDGKGNFSKQKEAFNIEDQITASSIVPYDFNNDKYIDFFMSARSISWSYGESPTSKVFINNGKGIFSDKTNEYIPDTKGEIGMVTDAALVDYDGDKDSDILLSVEWEKLKVLDNNNNKFTLKELPVESGLWSSIDFTDFDRDGDIDIIAGNHGLNSKFIANDKEPLSMYYADFDKNGKKEQFITLFDKGKEVPFAMMKELHKQMPSLKKKFLYAGDFSKLPLDKIMETKKLNAAKKFEVTNLASIIYENKGKGAYVKHELPQLSQFSVIKDFALTDINNDAWIDIIPLSNYYECNSQLGRFDADPGIVIMNKGNFKFEVSTMGSPYLKGQSRRIITSNNRVLIAKNNDKMQVLEKINRKDN